MRNGWYVLKRGMCISNGITFTVQIRYLQLENTSPATRQYDPLASTEHSNAHFMLDLISTSLFYLSFFL